MSAANIIDQSEQQDDYPEFPAWLRVENRQPLTPEQQARVDAAMAQASPPTAGRGAPASNVVRKKEKNGRVPDREPFGPQGGRGGAHPAGGPRGADPHPPTNFPHRGKPRRGAAGRGGRSGLDAQTPS